MLSVHQIEVAYDELKVLFGVSLSVAPGEILCLLGRNGAGKTTTLRSIMGLLPLRAGEINLDDERLDLLSTHEVPKRGIAYVPQGRGLFSELTVAQNLEIGLMVRNSPGSVREEILGLFPQLRRRLRQRAETLSGGEQQMLAMARAMCIQPKVILLDEPTEGLQPSMTELIRQMVLRLKEQHVAVVLVEQHVEAALSMADTIAFVENGRVPETMAASELNIDSPQIAHYLGV